MRSKLLIVLAVLVVFSGVFIGVVAMQPDEFRVTRSALIKGPAAEVSGHVSDFRKWEAWSPWAKLDPNAKNEFEGPAQGVGTVFKWSGNDEVGEGKMTLLEDKPGEFVKINLEFIKPMACVNITEFQFAPEGDQTKVVWTMYGPNNFMGKLAGLFMNLDEMVGKDFEKGLANLKGVVETPEKPTETVTPPAAASPTEGASQP
jgi:hypothetical protein